MSLKSDFSHDVLWIWTNQIYIRIESRPYSMVRYCIYVLYSIKAIYTVGYLYLSLDVIMHINQSLSLCMWEKASI